MGIESNIPKEINFSLIVKVKERVEEGKCIGIDSDSPIDIILDLNPGNKIIDIKESFSTRADLVAIFKRISKLLAQINDRSSDYSKVLRIDEEARKSFPEDYAFSEEAINGEYDDNFKPTFEKIDKIIYRHQSPGVASVSYARTYNGDKKPRL